jgi:dolichyl-phosphate beta-glucosyltransferase
MDFSIIIPVYNEAAKIKADILAAEEFLCSTCFEGEIIVVDDGSTDETEKSVRQVQVRQEVTLKFIPNEVHKGKGSTVRQGILASSGKIVMFSDSGSCIPFEQALRGVKLLEKQSCDVAHASRKLPDSEILSHQSLYRRFCSRIFRFLAITIACVPRNLSDTQCGFKVYKGNIARKIYNQSKINGFLFDIEIILLAIQNSYKIKEFPVSWRCDKDSRLSGLSFFGIVRELLQMRRWHLKRI